jgi:hypothetical protein
MLTYRRGIKIPSLHCRAGLTDEPEAVGILILEAADISHTSNRDSEPLLGNINITPGFSVTNGG